MTSCATAIVHLRRQDRPLRWSLLDRAMRPLQGILAVELTTADAIVAISFDERLTGLADIIRSLEDCGASISGVSQRNGSA